jgi:hypothetical protein
MHCRRARRDLQLKSDDRLPFERELALGAHLDDCADCRAFEATLERIDETLARWPEPASDRIDMDAAISNIRARIDADAPTQAAAPRPRRTAVLAAAAVLLALVAGSLALRALRDDTEAPRLAQDRPDRRIAPSDELAENANDALIPHETVASAQAVADPSDSLADAAPPAEPLEPIDQARVLAAREFLRATLSSLDAELAVDASTDEARAFAATVDAKLRAGGSWPWRRMSERLLQDDDVALANTAARYVGIGADRLSIAALASALDRVECAPSVAFALRDADSATHPAFAAALRDPARSSVAFVAMLDAPPTARAALLDSAWRGFTPAERDGAAAQSVLEALADTGPPALTPLLDAGRRDEVSEDRLVALLTPHAWAPEELLDRAWSARRSTSGELTLALCAHLAGEAALDPLEQQLGTNGLRDAALRGFVTVGGSDAFARLVALHEAGRLEFDHVDAALHRLTDDAPDAPHAALLVAADAALESGNSAFRRAMAGWVLSLETSAAVPALHLVADDVRFDPELRRDALLAIGELGGIDDADQLIESFKGFHARDRHLAAACLIAIFGLDGEAAAERALEGATPRITRSALTALRQSRQRDRELSTHRLARVLAPLLDERGTAAERSQS